MLKKKVYPKGKEKNKKNLKKKEKKTVSKSLHKIHLRSEISGSKL